MYLFWLNQFQMFSKHFKLCKLIFSLHCVVIAEMNLRMVIACFSSSLTLFLCPDAQHVWEKHLVVFCCPAYMEPARDVYLDHLGVWGFWMEHQKIQDPLLRPVIGRAAVSDILYFIRRCRDRPHPAKNGKG